MSMSEFETNMGEEHNLSVPHIHDMAFPADFSKDEMDFVQELGSLFATDKEEIPPYFVQTLLEAAEPRLQPAESCFEQKTSAHVFRRLRLRRHLFRAHCLSLLEKSSLSSRHAPMALIAACLLFVILTVMATSPTFALGLEILLSGTHSGVVQVITYPKSLFSSHQAKTQVAKPHPRPLTLRDAQQQLHFLMYWPLSMPDNYVLSEISLFHQQEQQWADGPLLGLNYTYSLGGIAAHGMEQITIYEFKPLGNVFQVVPSGAAHVIYLDQASHTQAIYVNGQWVHISRYAHSWLYGIRSELIYEHDGVIFWIVGDQRAGVDSKVLLSIASSLQLFHVQRVTHTEIRAHVHVVNEQNDDSNWLLSGDVVYSDSSEGSFFRVIGADMSIQPSPSATHLR
ncbi:MAG: hypothetical protein JO202_19250 [Ktedonobacteraceae bacterium]|nr:hypothetical protein [Ktedonobacteraceae bacterium]